jgi:hypothetical protein
MNNTYEIRSTDVRNRDTARSGLAGPVRRLAVAGAAAAALMLGACSGESGGTGESSGTDESTAKQVQELADRQEILSLSTIYSDGVIQGNIDDIMSVFTEDASTELPSDALTQDSTDPAESTKIETKGAPALKAQYESMVETLHPIPAVSINRITSLDGDTATGRSMSEIRFRDNPKLINLASYEDEYKKIDGKWKFHHRVIRVQKLEQK